MNAALEATNANPWAWYLAALKSPEEIGKASLPVHESEPQQGYYRVRRKGAPWEPVAIFYPTGSNDLIAYRGDKEVQDINALWVWCCRNPVEYEAYMAVRDGAPWPDDDIVVAAQVAPTIGDNSKTIDEAEVIKDQIEAALAGIEAYKKITDDETSAKALSLRNRLNELSTLAEKKHEVEKKPHWELCKTIDAKWLPSAKSAKAGANSIRSAMEAWETEKLRRVRVIERQKADELRRQQEAARAAEPIRSDPEPASKPVQSEPISIKPTYGRAANVSTTLVVKEVTDYAALYAYMAGREEVQTVLRTLAQKALDAGRTNIPGITTEEKAKVR